MQFHLNGFKGSDDPLKLQFDGDEPDFQTSLPEEVDVLIVGAGPAGLLLATQLAQFKDIKTRIIESKPGPLQQGQADGLQCRTIEIFQAFRFAEKVLKEAYWVNETTFWSPGEDGTGLRRTGRVRDTEEGTSEFPHVILNQARLHGLWLEAMKWSPTRLEPSYDRRLIELSIPEAGPIQLHIEKGDGATEHVTARYVVGCDGARSAVRAGLGLEMHGDFANQGWGVMDALVVTDFPDLRLKTIIRSATEGSILIIPREGGYLVRLYIELDEIGDQERIASKGFTSDILIERAKRIFAPFSLEVKQLAYWSVYEVGQRLTQHFDDVPPAEVNTRTPRVFIAGDACHTHSAKAGQGMNVSMNDAYNLGWKLASVIRGHANPRLLHTYTQERQNIARELIDFDRKIAKLFAIKNAETNGDTDRSTQDSTFQDYFVKQGRFMAGLMTRYPPSMITNAETSHQHLATGFQIGERFQSCQVVRLADAKPVQLGHELKADGRWRIFIFNSTEDVDDTSLLNSICNHFAAHFQSLCDHKRSRVDIDAIIDVRAILQHKRQDVDWQRLPHLLRPQKGAFSLVDYEKIFTDEPSYNFGFGDIFNARGISREGCIIVVRPDQYVSGIWPLQPDSPADIVRWFSQIFISSDVGE